MSEQRSFYIAGVKFHQLATIIEKLKVNNKLTLVPEPTNKFDPNAVNKISEATGIGQLLLGATLDGCMHFNLTCRDIDAIRKDPELNIKISSWYLHSRIVRYGNMDLGLAYYSGGERCAVGWRYYKKYEGKNIKDTNIIKIINNVRPQTKQYVPKIRKLEKKFKKLVK